MKALLYGTAAYNLIAFSFSVAFGLIGMLHLVGPPFLKRAYCETPYSGHFYRSAGLWMLLAAAMLIFPYTRVAGAVLCGCLTFAMTVLMMDCRRYVALVLAIPMLVMLLAVVIVRIRGV